MKVLRLNGGILCDDSKKQSKPHLSSDARSTVWPAIWKWKCVAPTPPLLICSNLVKVLSPPWLHNSSQFVIYLKTVYGEGRNLLSKFVLSHMIDTHFFPFKNDHEKHNSHIMDILHFDAKLIVNEVRIYDYIMVTALFFVLFLHCLRTPSLFCLVCYYHRVTDKMIIIE